MTKPRLSEVLALPFRRPLLLALALLLSGILYGAGLQADLDEIGDPQWVVTMAVLLLVSPLFNGAYILAVQAYRGGGRPSFSGTLARVLSVYPRLVVGQIVVNALVVGGAFLFIVPGIYFGLRLAFYKQAILLEGRTFARAVGESLRQTPTGREAFLLLLYVAPFYAPSILTYVVTIAFPLGTAGDALALTGSILTFAWTNVLVTTLYVPSPPRPAEARGTRAP
jgi:hypothetical protein